MKAALKAQVMHHHLLALSELLADSAAMMEGQLSPEPIETAPVEYCRQITGLVMSIEGNLKIALEQISAAKLLNQMPVKAG